MIQQASAESPACGARTPRSPQQLRRDAATARRLEFLIATTLLASSLAACTVDGSPTPPAPVDAAGQVRQVDDEGRQLPFETEFSERWNQSNDGTPYEPCTAPSTEQLLALRLDPDSAADAATVNGQTLRGCHWGYRPPIDSGWSLAQSVGDYESIADYSRTRSPGEARPIIGIDERDVGVFVSESGGCWTYVQSRRSGVITLSVYVGLPEPPTSLTCQRAIDFTRAAINKIPK